MEPSGRGAAIHPRSSAMARSTRTRLRRRLALRPVGSVCLPHRSRRRVTCWSWPPIAASGHAGSPPVARPVLPGGISSRPNCQFPASARRKPSPFRAGNRDGGQLPSRSARLRAAACPRVTSSPVPRRASANAHDQRQWPCHRHRLSTRRQLLAVLRHRRAIHQRPCAEHHRRGRHELTTTSATLNGTINPNGTITTAKFQSGTTAGYGTDTAITLSPTGGRDGSKRRAPCSRDCCPAPPITSVSARRIWAEPPTAATSFSPPCTTPISPASR